MIVFRPPSRSDVEELAANMRAIDVLECRAMSGHSPMEALEYSIEGSSWSVTAEVDGRVMAIFGVAATDMLSGDGAPWLLGAQGIERCARLMLIYTRHYLRRMQGEYDMLANAVHVENKAAIRYLKWCGFEFGAHFTRNGETFAHFSWARRDQARKAA